jgi:hypothetical protein
LALIQPVIAFGISFSIAPLLLRSWKILRPSGRGLFSLNIPGRRRMAVRDIIFHHIDSHRQQVGFDLPLDLEWYLVDLVTDRLARVDIIPDPSFAERYLQLCSETRLGQFKDYADTSLFFVSLMPEYGRRRGLDISYYSSLGRSAYYTLGDLSEDPRYTQLGNWFYYLQQFLDSALHPRRGLDLWSMTKVR